MIIDICWYYGKYFRTVSYW